MTLLTTAIAYAQTGRPKEEENAKAPPSPQHEFLTTADGWRIRGTYYPPPGTRRGPEVVPVIAVHGWGGHGAEYRRLAEGLQSWGLAVLTVDLRGHGRSTSCRGPDGLFMTVDYKALTPTQILNTTQDLEACKRFLMQRNNAGEVNIDWLVVVAAEEGCLTALNWTAQDWSWPSTTAGKQGQDVKALVLLSPVLTQGRVNARQALDHPAIRSQVSLMIAVGANERRRWSEAKRLYERLEKGRDPLPEDESERLTAQDLFLFGEDTTLQGTHLLDRHLPIARRLAIFIDLRVLRRGDAWPWAKRTNVLGE